MLSFPKFEDNKVSTHTFIVCSNAIFDIPSIFENLEITPYVVVPKKRGRKKKTEIQNPNVEIPDGSIITLELGNELRGVRLKKKKVRKGKNYFRNSLTVVMMIEGKLVNSKITRNGKFQMTGCKFESHAEKFPLYIWEKIKDTKRLYELPEGKSFSATFIPAMRNIDFSMGFLVDREKIDEYFNMNTDYNSLLEPSVGYTGVNIKIPIEKSLDELLLKRLKYKKGVWKVAKPVPYPKYLNTLGEKEKQKKKAKKNMVSFLVFHSGQVIMSSMCAEVSKDIYYKFINIIKENFELFREKLTNDSEDGEAETLDLEISD